MFEEKTGSEAGIAYVCVNSKQSMGFSPILTGATTTYATSEEASEEAWRTRECTYGLNITRRWRQNTGPRVKKVAVVIEIIFDYLQDFVPIMH